MDVWCRFYILGLLSSLCAPIIERALMGGSRFIITAAGRRIADELQYRCTISRLCRCRAFTAFYHDALTNILSARSRHAAQSSTRRAGAITHAAMTIPAPQASSTSCRRLAR